MLAGFHAAKDFLDIKTAGTDAVVTASVHMDETTPHMHYIHLPLVPNTRYREIADRFNIGIKQVQSKYNCIKSDEQLKRIAEIIVRYEDALQFNKQKDIDACRKECIRNIRQVLNVEYDTARSIFSKITRSEVERYEKKFASNCIYTREFLRRFHPDLQHYLDGQGIKCTVQPHPGSGIALTVRIYSVFLMRRMKRIKFWM